MRCEQPRTATIFQDADLCRDDIESIGINDNWVLRALNQVDNFRGVFFSQSGSDSPDIDVFIEQIPIGPDWFNHRFKRRGSSDDVVDIFRYEDFNQPGAAAQRTPGTHGRGSGKAARPSDNSNASELIFVRFELAPW